VRFDGRNPRAERYLAERSSGLIVEILEDTRDGIRAWIANGMVDGRNPRNTALDIVGRINRATGRREGGIVGLTSQQMGYVANMRADLADPERMAGYFDRARRDKRFDGLVRRAMRDGKPLAQADIDRIAARYSDRLLSLRGETIARTESMTALNEARYEAVQQQIDAGNLAPGQVEWQWQANLDGRVRDSHSAMHMQTVRHGDAFVSPVTGARMRYPMDRALGAGAGDIINCRCILAPKIDYLAGLSRRVA
jgi:hypothetical protein